MSHWASILHGLFRYKGKHMLRLLFLLVYLVANVHAQDLQIDVSVSYFFFGAFGMILIYNWGYLLVLKTPVYSSYFLFHAGLFIIMLFYTGVVETYWFDTHIHDIPVMVFFLTAAAFIGFSRDMLDLKLYYPHYEKYLNALIMVNLGFMGLSEFIPYNDGVELLIIFFISIEVISLLFISAWLSLKDQAYARLYLLSFSLLLISVGCVVLEFFRVIDLNGLTPYWFETAILVEATGLSFAVAMKHRDSEIQLRQKEILFKELSHRIQNNLQQIISILTLQKSQTQDALVREHLEETISRIGSISLIHKTLQKTSLPGSLNIRTYLQTFIEGYRQLHPKISFEVECDDILLSMDKLTPLGLILNELITNSIKHAFEGIDHPRIKISFIQDKQVVFRYEDNGKGFEEATDSVGTTLINLLSISQLKGEMTIDTTGGYHYALKFSL